MLITLLKSLLIVDSSVENQGLLITLLKSLLKSLVVDNSVEKSVDCVEVVLIKIKAPAFIMNTEAFWKQSGRRDSNPRP